MKKSPTNEPRNPERFARLLAERQDTLDRRGATGHDNVHIGTERLLIHLAFERLRSNEYWTCVKCKSAIAETRLLANPTTLTCSGCEPDAQ